MGVVALAAAGVAGWSFTEAPPPPEPARPTQADPALTRPLARLHAPGPVYALGDVHGDPAGALAALRLGGLVDERGAWIGGTAWLVQTGDLLDRGADSRGVLVLMRRLEIESRAAGGRVIVLDGNHEVMNLQGDWRYVSPEDLAGYGGEAARKAAFDPSGPDGAWVLDHDIAVQVDETVFVHGGIDDHWATYGVTALNGMARAAMKGAGPPDVLGSDGPLWNRVYLQAGDVVACPMLDRALVALGAERMVVGHTVQESGKIAEKCGGRLYGIDTGISAHYGSHASLLKIERRRAEALYPPGG